MADERVTRAARVLRVYLATVASPSDHGEAAALLGLMYEDRFGGLRIDPADPQAVVEELRRRFDEIITGHLALESVLLSIVGRATGQSAEQILSRVLATDVPGGSTR